MSPVGAASAAVLLLLGVAVAPEIHAERAASCASGVLAGGARYTIAAPVGWSARRDGLILFAPGYRFPDDRARADPDIDPRALEALGALGFAVATLDYRKAGLAVKEGVQDVGELFDFLTGDPQGCGYGRPANVWLIGGSEGAIVATLVAERQSAEPEPLVDGVLAACGPIGDFRYQLDYITDFRIVFDALFPGVIPGSAVSIPPEVADAWDETYAPRIRALLAAHPVEIEQLLRMTGAAYVAGDVRSIETTVLTLLRYNVGATNDAIATLGGRPFDNTTRVYSGSGDAALDMLVDARAERVAADPAALAELVGHYQTSGGARVPLITLHTLADPLVPYRHAELFAQKAAVAQGEHYGIPIDRYGHCAFEPAEVLGALLGVVLLSR